MVINNYVDLVFRKIEVVHFQLFLHVDVVDLLKLDIDGTRDDIMNVFLSFHCMIEDKIKNYLYIIIDYFLCNN